MKIHRNALIIHWGMNKNAYALKYKENESTYIESITNALACIGIFKNKLKCIKCIEMHVHAVVYIKCIHNALKCIGNANDMHFACIDIHRHALNAFGKLQMY